MGAECNVGGVERIARVGVGAGLIGLGLFVPMNKWLAIALETAGIASASTGIAEYCPISKVMGRSTCVVTETVGESPVSLRVAG